MSNAIQATIIEYLHRLDEQRQAEVLDFVEYLASKAKTAPAVSWPAIDPARDLAPFIVGATGFPDDAVAWQRHIRDSEWR